MSPESVLVVTTTDDRDVATRIARLLVDRRVAAGVQIAQVDSVYRWQGAIHAHPEFKLTIKTVRRHFRAVEALIAAEHTYELPQIVMIAIEDGLAAYLDWISDETAAGENAP